MFSNLFHFYPLSSHYLLLFFWGKGNVLFTFNIQNHHHSIISFTSCTISWTNCNNSQIIFMQKSIISLCKTNIKRFLNLIIIVKQRLWKIPTFLLFYWNGGNQTNSYWSETSWILWIFYYGQPYCMSGIKQHFERERISDFHGEALQKESEAYNFVRFFFFFLSDHVLSHSELW